MNLKKGTPGYGILLGTAFMVCGVLLLTIGFWKTVLLAVLFAIGYFCGTVENKGEFLREKANQLIPQKEKKVIDFRTELVKEQEEQMARSETVQHEDEEKTRQGL